MALVYNYIHLGSSAAETASIYLYKCNVTSKQFLNVKALNLHFLIYLFLNTGSLSSLLKFRVPILLS